MVIPAVIAFVAAYAVGALPVAWILVRRRHGIDLRSRGTGRTGAAGTLFVAGPQTAVLTGLLECAKGAAVGLCAQLYSSAGWFVALAIAGCVVGDAFPPLYRRGGRGLLPLVTGLFVAIPAAGAITAVAAIPVALLTSTRGRLYDTVVAIAVPVGLVLGTRDWRSLIAAGIIVATLLGRQAIRRRRKDARLVRQPAWASILVDADAGFPDAGAERSRPRQNPRPWET